ncbi:unnamed protein product [Rodentolepis nana]|uniref:Protein kinase domain-containing protein n=1 Tax=Rodentolepis nana TaxID=102285 RepID=A0A0R3TJC9_RODNA|nr:unnamed protein product [Rodentolepis nana]
MQVSVVVAFLAKLVTSSHVGSWKDARECLKVNKLSCLCNSNYSSPFPHQIRREAHNLGQLSHRNVVEFFGIWETPASLSQLPALVMEFAHGGALHRVVRRRPAVHCSTLADWALQVAEGMRYLHEKVGLVHQDLKTANILIREPLVQSPGPDDLTGKTLIISDFGMSCPADALSSRVSGVGTVAYAAPEVICMRMFSLASDVWSYGVVLWEIFTMLEPFKELDPGQQLAKIGRYRQKLLIPRSDIGFSETIGSLLARCWDDEPEERPTFSDICNYLIEAQNDEFFSLSTEEFTSRQEIWVQEISGDAELSLLTESCSSEASSPLRRQNEFLQQENAKMRDALQALQQNEARYRGTIAGLQKDNQILSVLVANTLLKNTLAPPAPRKKPFMYNLFRRNEEKKNITPLVSGSTNGAGDNESPITIGCSNVIDAAINSAAADRPPRDCSPVVKSSTRHHGKTSRKSILGISYPQKVRHMVHVPLNLFGESNNDLYPPIYRGNFSSGGASGSPTSPLPPIGGGSSSISNSSFPHRPRTDSQSTDPPLHPSSYVFSPSDEAADIAHQFAFLYTQNHNNGTAASGTLGSFQLPLINQQQQKYASKSGRVSANTTTGGLTSYKSAPELCEQADCSKVRLNTFESGWHTVSRGCEFYAANSTSDRKAIVSSSSGVTGGGGGSVSTSKRHRIGLSSLFHPSRSKHNSGSGKPSSPSCTTNGTDNFISPLTSPPPDFSPTSPNAFHSTTPTTTSAVTSLSTLIPGVPLPKNRSSSSKSPSGGKVSHTTKPRRLLHKIFQSADKNGTGSGSRPSRRVSISNGGTRKISGKKTRPKESPPCRDSTPSDPILPPDGCSAILSSLDDEEAVDKKMQSSHSFALPIAEFPPLPPYYPQKTNQNPTIRRRLIDLISPPSSNIPSATRGAPPIPRPCTLTSRSTEGTIEFKGSLGAGPRRRPYIPRLKSQSLDVLYHSDDHPDVEKQRQGSISKEGGENGDAIERGGDGEAGGDEPVNPVPMALWSALQIASIAPLLFDCQTSAPLPPPPQQQNHSNTAPQSASFARVTFSPFAMDELDQAEDVLGKAQSCLGRISSTLALSQAASSSAMRERSRQPTRRHQWNTQRELSAPAPSSSPWQRKLSQLPPVYYSPPPSAGNGASREACCKCGCHSAGGGTIDVGVSRSRHSSTTTNSSSQSPSRWLPVENPVALSRDAYLKVTQDGYLNRATVDDILDDDELAVDEDLVGDVDNGDGNDLTIEARPSQSSILLARSLRGTGGFSPSTSSLFPSPISPTLFQKQQASEQQQLPVANNQNSNLQQGAEGEHVDDDDDDVVVIQLIIQSENDAGGDCELEEGTGEPSFGAGEAAEDTSALYEEFKSISSHQWIPYRDDGTEKSDVGVEEGWRNGYLITESENSSGVLSSPTTDRPNEFPSIPCRRRKAFRLKDKPEGLLSSPEDDGDNGGSDKPVLRL